MKLFNKLLADLFVRKYQGILNSFFLPAAIITFICLFLCLLEESAAFSGSAAMQTTPQQEQVQLRQFKKANIAVYLADENFRYDRNFRPEVPTLWQRIQQWLFDKLIESLGNEQTRDYWRWAIYIFCGLVILYVILKLTQTNIRSLFFGPASGGQLPYTVAQENIHALDFEQMIAEAIAAQQYGRAIRLFYLKVLKQLTDRQFIDWRINKTNHDYLRELGNKEISPAFRNLTSLFEYIYYGDFQITQADFEQARAAFQQFEDQLKQAR